MEPQQKKKNFKCTVFCDVTPWSLVDHRNHCENLRSKKELSYQAVVSAADKPAGQFVLNELDAAGLVMQGM